MSGLGPVVALLWKELGLAPPLGVVGAQFEFELDDVPISLSLQDNGETVLLRGRIGWLEGNAHEAGDQLSRVFRLGLGLTALNGAVLDASEAEDVLDRDHEGLVPVFAVAKADLSAPSSVLTALRAVLDWKTVTGSILTQGSEDEGSAPKLRRSGDAAPETDMIIFQP